MSDLAWIGVWLLIISVALILVEGALAGMWTLRIAQRSRVLSEWLVTERAGLQQDVERLRISLEETQRLWQPYRRALRWLRHPLVIALLQSFVRRRTAVR
ncbi:MAG TPA: hypothetical protein VJT78_00380 [Candidatus Dormibacteraeota bacterium]|nr:hypothetical protein [Candidatus Dormibacteraeota bacterium]